MEWKVLKGGKRVAGGDRSVQCVDENAFDVDLGIEVKFKASSR